MPATPALASFTSEQGVDEGRDVAEPPGREEKRAGHEDETTTGTSNASRSGREK